MFADKFKMIGEQWGSMVAPYSEEVPEDSLASRWPEYHSLKVYSDKERTNGHKQSSSYKNRRSSHDQKSRHRKHDRNDSRNVSIQTDPDFLMASTCTQTSGGHLPLHSKALEDDKVLIDIFGASMFYVFSLATSEFYQNQLRDLKEVYSSMVFILHFWHSSCNLYVLCN